MWRRTSPTRVRAITRVALECLDDDRMGEEFSVIWEREVNTRVLHADAFPTPSGRWDHPDMFDAFLTALRWTSSSVLSSAGLQAPFRGAIEIEPYQLEPAARAVMMPRVNLLIADDVGLGKTIEAGLVLQGNSSPVPVFAAVSSPARHRCSGSGPTRCSTSSTSASTSSTATRCSGSAASTAPTSTRGGASPASSPPSTTSSETSRSASSSPRMSTATPPSGIS
jgi:hypothetical protein